MICQPNNKLDNLKLTEICIIVKFRIRDVGRVTENLLASLSLCVCVCVCAGVCCLVYLLVCVFLFVIVFFSVCLR